MSQPATTWRQARRFIAPALLIVLWQVAAATHLVSPRLAPAPSAILATAYDLVRSGELVDSLRVSLGRVAAGLAIGLSLGSILALVAGLSRVGEDAIDATVQMLRTLPFLGLVPLFILWFGIAEAPKIAMVAVGTAFPIYVALFSGIRSTDKKLLEAGTVFGLTRAERIFGIILPGALPQALIGLRYALSISFLSLVVSEQVNADSGIGYLITSARDFLRTDIIFVGLLVYALLGLAADLLVRLLEKRLLFWRPSIVGA